MMMKKLLLVVACACACIATARAQSTWIVNATGTVFADVASGTNVTTIQLGDTVRWNRLNGSHTVTSGASPTDPQVGALFNFSLSGATTFVTYTPTAPGTIVYHCNPHFPFGMTGTIVVQPPALYPGSSEDFGLGTAVNTPGGTINAPSYGGGVDVKTAHAADVMTIQAKSFGSTFNFAPLVIAGQFFTTGTPAPIGALPGLHVNVSGGFVIVNGLDPSALGTLQVVIPGGATYGYTIPVGLAGQSLMVQCFAFATTAANGIFAISSGHEIRFL